MKPKMRRKTRRLLPRNGKIHAMDFGRLFRELETQIPAPPEKIEQQRSGRPFQDCAFHPCPELLVLLVVNLSETQSSVTAVPALPQLAFLTDFQLNFERSFESARLFSGLLPRLIDLAPS